MKRIVAVLAVAVMMAGCAMVPTQDGRGVAASASVPFGDGTPVQSQGFFAAAGQAVSDHPYVSSASVAAIGAAVVTAYQAYNKTGVFHSSKSEQAAALSASTTAGAASAAPGATVVYISGPGNNVVIGSGAITLGGESQTGAAGATGPNQSTTSYP